MVAEIFWQPTLDFHTCVALVQSLVAWGLPAAPFSIQKSITSHQALNVFLYAESEAMWKDERSHDVTNTSDHFKHQDVGMGCPRCVMVKALDCRIVVSEFELQSCFYVHFRRKV